MQISPDQSSPWMLDFRKQLIRGKHKAMDVKRDVHDRYNDVIDAGNAKMAWGISKAPTWYRNEKGHVTQNWPFSLIRFWMETKTADPKDFAFSD